MGCNKSAASFGPQQQPRIQAASLVFHQSAQWRNLQADGGSAVCPALSAFCFSAPERLADKKTRWRSQCEFTLTRVLFFFNPAPDIQILMGSLVYLRHGIENSPYRSLLETNQWAEICNIFTRDACALLGLSVESPLSVRFEALSLVPLSLPCVGRSSILSVDKCIICSCKCSESHHTCVSTVLHQAVWLCQCWWTLSRWSSRGSAAACGHIKTSCLWDCVALTSPFSSSSVEPSRWFTPVLVLADWNRPGEEVLVSLRVRLPHPQAADVGEQPTNEAHLRPRHLQRRPQQTD